MGTKRMYVLGLDAYVVRLVKRFVDEGCLPNFQRMFEEGGVAEVLPSIPAYTPTNWTTLSTGAQTGTHGLPRWTAEVADGRTVSSFDARAVAAETIFEAADRQGVGTIAIRFPATMPSALERGYVVDGFGTPNNSSPYQIARFSAYKTWDDDSPCESVSLGPPADWVNAPDCNPSPLASEITIEPLFGGEPKTLHLLVVASGGDGYDCVLLCADKDASAPLATLEVGKFCEWVRVPFQMAIGLQDGYMRFKLMALSASDGRFWLYRTQVNLADKFTHPDSLAAELIARFGPFHEHLHPQIGLGGCADYDTALEEAEYQGTWIVRVATYMFEEKGCRLFGSHWHWSDHQTHAHLAGVDPASPHYDAATAPDHWEKLRLGHQIADRMLGHLLDGLDDDTAVVVVSDHGNSPNIRGINIDKFLEEKGYLVYEEDGKTIDWDKTTSYSKGRYDLFINAEGDTFREIQDRLVTDLRTWIDPGTGKCAIAMALTKEDSQVVGYWGDEAPDVLAVWEKGYGGGVQGGGSIGLSTGGANHGSQFPTTCTEVSSILGTFMVYGKDFKKGYWRPHDRLGYMRMIDVVPTVCHHLGIEPPAQCQGAACFDFFEGREIARDRPIHRTSPVDEHFRQIV